MKRLSIDTHERIIFWAKVAMFTVFSANVMRILYKIWRYGGNKKRDIVEFDDGDALVDDTEGDVDTIYRAYGQGYNGSKEDA